MPSWPQLFSQVLTKVAIQSDPLKGLGQKIFDLCPAPAKLLEVGFGSACLSGYLADFGFRVVGVDSDPAVIRYAKNRLASEMLGSPEGDNPNPLLLERDALHLADGLSEYAPFDLCWSAGLLEHYPDDQIVEMLKQQLAVARICCFSVPSELYPRKEFGDERNLPLPHWFGLCESLGDTIETPCLSYFGGNLHIMGVLRQKEGQS